MFKKILKERLIIIFVISVCFLVSVYYYRKDKISFMPKKVQEKKVIVPFSGKEYLLNFQNTELKSKTIAKFEEDEKWEGDGELDSANFFEGKFSQLLNSQDHHESTIIIKLKEKIKIEDFSIIKFLINLRTSPENIEDFDIILIDTNSQAQARYSLRDLSQNWTLLSIPLDKFSISENNRIEFKNFDRVIFRLVSRPKSLTTINLDWIWLENSDDYLKNWDTLSPKFISLARIDNNTKLLTMNLGASVATIKSIASPKNFNFQADFTPLKAGRFGIFLKGQPLSNYGYYFLLDGVGTNKWQIFKIGMFDNTIQTILLKKGSLDDLLVETGKQYNLKVEARNLKYSFFISLDGKDYTKLDEISDDSFLSGMMGFSCLDGSIVLLDNFYFFQ